MPRYGSKFLTASSRPTLPSWIRSSRLWRARWYSRATSTTSRRLDVTGLPEALGAAVLRHLYREAHVEVARRTALGVRDAATAQPQPLPALAALRDLQLHAPVGRGDGDGRAEHRLADRHRDLDGEILAVALDVRMRPDLDDEVEVARPAPAARRAAFALHANACPVAHAGRDLNRETLALLGLPGSGASRACAATLPPGPAAVRT